VGLIGCDLETSTTRRSRSDLGCCATGKNKTGIIVKHDIEAPLRKNFYHEKSMRIKCSVCVCVCVALVAQHATRIRCIVICGLSGSSKFFDVFS
jgi:hypothetical protein